MGFDWDKVLSSSSKISIASGKHKFRKNRVANATCPVDIIKPIEGKGGEKVPINQLKSSKGNEWGNSKHENVRKEFSGVESKRVGSKKSKNLSVNSQKVSLKNKRSAKSDVRGNSNSNLSPKPFPSSPCDSRKRSPHCSLSQESPKSARTVLHSSSKIPVCRGDRTPVTDSSAGSHSGVLAPKSHHGRDVLSFGNIYKASKNLIPEQDSPDSNKIQPNSIVPQGSCDLISGATTPNRSNNNVFGFGGLNYGHGSIIKCVKNAVNLPSKPEVVSKSIITENQNSLIPRKASELLSVEELKNSGNERYRRGFFTEALSFYDKAIQLCPQNAQCHNNKAAALAGLGKCTEAVGECIEAINCDPSYSSAHYRLGNLYTRLGRVEDAKSHFKLSGCDLGSEAMKRLLRLEHHLVTMTKAQTDENWELALAESTHSLEAGADVSTQVVAVNAEALLKLHRAKEALELLRAARNSAEGRSRKACEGTSFLLVLETQAYLYLGRFEEGVFAAEIAVSFDPNSKSLMWLRIATCVADARKAGTECFKAGKYSKACKMYDKGLQHAPSNSVLLCNRAACRFELGQWEMAVDDCNSALRNHPNYSKALLRRAQSYAKLERWEESLRDYSKLSKAMPRDKTIYNSLLEVQMELRKAKKSL